LRWWITLLSQPKPRKLCKMQPKYMSQSNAPLTESIESRHTAQKRDPKWKSEIMVTKVKTFLN